MITQRDLSACAQALQCHEDILEYVSAALDTEDPQAIAFALGVAARAAGVAVLLLMPTGDDERAHHMGYHHRASATDLRRP